MKVCNKCVLNENVDDIDIGEDGICNFCKLEVSEKKNQSKFKNEEELIEYFRTQKKISNKYDVLVPLSGGVDSCNALITIVEKYKLKPLVFHNDHGYEDEIATENAKKICKALDTDLIIMQRDLKFMKKLWKYCNELNVKGLHTCYICGNILYLNCLEIAHNFGINLMINGYSKGQISMVKDKEKGLSFLEKLIIYTKDKDQEFVNDLMAKYNMLQKVKLYDEKEDLYSQIEDGKILVIPFYIFDFYKTSKDILKNKVMKYCDWKAMDNSFPNRTTNCNMVWLNTYMDMKKMGYSSYDLEYSELIRKGEMTREQAVLDLKFNQDMEFLKRLAKEIDLDIECFDNYDICTPFEENLNILSISEEIEKDCKFEW